jgi:hypothetical protein
MIFFTKSTQPPTKHCSVQAAVVLAFVTWANIQYLCKRANVLNLARAASSTPAPLQARQLPQCPGIHSRLPSKSVLSDS